MLGSACGAGSQVYIYETDGYTTTNHTNQSCWLPPDIRANSNVRVKTGFNYQMRTYYEGTCGGLLLQTCTTRRRGKGHASSLAAKMMNSDNGRMFIHVRLYPSKPPDCQATYVKRFVTRTSRSSSHDPIVEVPYHPSTSTHEEF